MRGIRLVAFVACLLALAGGKASAQDVETTDETISTRIDATSDARIAKRLSTTFASLESVRDVEIRVEAGVVRLSGEVLSADARRLAGALAKQVDGVVAVENDLKESQALRPRLDAALRALEERGQRAIAALPLLAVALLILLAAFLVARTLGRSQRLFVHLTPNVFLQDIARQIGSVTVFLIGMLLALEILGATALVGAVLGAAGVAGLAVGFAFRDLVENYIASILMSIRRPFEPNDHVVIEGQEGKVVRLTSRATILLSFEGNHVRIPNAAVFKGTLVNFSRKPERRFDFLVGIGTDDDISGARTLAEETLRAIDGVLTEPEAFAIVETLGDSSVGLRVFGWIDQRRSDWARTRSEAIRRVKEAFDEAGIEMPEPIHRIRVEQAVPGAPHPRPVEDERARQDTSPDRHLDREIEAERAVEERDLLAPDAPNE